MAGVCVLKLLLGDARCHAVAKVDLAVARSSNRAALVEDAGLRRYFDGAGHVAPAARYVIDVVAV